MFCLSLVIYFEPFYKPPNLSYCPFAPETIRQMQPEIRFGWCLQSHLQLCIGRNKGQECVQSQKVFLPVQSRCQGNRRKVC